MPQMANHQAKMIQVSLSQSKVAQVPGFEHLNKKCCVYNMSRIALVYSGIRNNIGD